MTSRHLRLFTILTATMSLATCDLAAGWQTNYGPQGGQAASNPQGNQTQAGQLEFGTPNLLAGDGSSMPLQTGPQASPKRPSFVPLAPALQLRVEQLLQYWEQNSSQIQLYQCEFTRWEYNDKVCNWRDPENNHLAASAISKGFIRYGAPDRGMYETNQTWRFGGPPKQEGEKPNYKIAPGESEKWICDGTSIYEFDFENKRILDLVLPPEAQGEGLKNSPLPFVFGAKANDLLQRYWVREVTPQGVANQYWLEAWPKRTSDAQAYQKVEIILSADPFLPKSIHLYAPNYDAKTNPTKMVFEFEDRQINGTLRQLQNFFGVFIRPKTPSGWKRTKKTLLQDTGATQVPQVGQIPNQPNSK